MKVADRRSPQGRAALMVRAAVAIVLAAAALALLNRPFLAEIAGFVAAREWPQAVSRIGLLAVLLAFFVVVPAAAPRWIAWPFALLAAVHLWINDGYRRITGTPISEEGAEWLFAETGSLPDVIRQFGGPVAAAAAGSALVLALILLVRTVLAPALSSGPGAARWRALGWLASIAYVALVVALGARGPIPRSWESNLAGYMAMQAFAPKPAPGKPTMRAGAQGVRNVVLVIDESMHPQVLRETFGAQLAALGALEVPNAWSAVACSAASNALLRWGVNPHRQPIAPADPREGPGLFGYARAAGYRTHMFDGQSGGGWQNFMTRPEAAQIDAFVPMGRHGRHADPQIARSLRELLTQPGRRFVLVVKRGIHWPYDNHYEVTAQNRDLPLAQRYRLAMRTSNDGFFEALADAARNGDTLVAYTSDHSQDFSPGRLAHCNPVPGVDELVVPLWVFGAGSSLQQAVAARAADVAHSTLQLFPTLLQAMGYAADEVRERYGPSLAEFAGTPWVMRTPPVPYPFRSTGPVTFHQGLPQPGKTFQIDK